MIRGGEGEGGYKNCRVHLYTLYCLRHINGSYSIHKCHNRSYGLSARPSRSAASRLVTVSVSAHWLLWPSGGGHLSSLYTQTTALATAARTVAARTGGMWRSGALGQVTGRGRVAKLLKRPKFSLEFVVRHRPALRREPSTLRGAKH